MSAVISFTHCRLAGTTSGDLADIRNAGPGAPALEVIQGDLSKPETLRGLAEDIDTIIHAAGYAHVAGDSPGIHTQVTLEGTRHLLAEAEKSGAQRFIFISSVKAMPEPGDRLSGRDGDGPA